MKMTIPVSSIETDQGTQARAALDERTIKEYSGAMKNGKRFPSVMVFEDGDGKRWLGDGFHRVEAARRAGKTEIKAIVEQGSQRDALLYAVGANATHGLRRNRKDLRRAVALLLQDPEWSQWSNRAIADQVKVDEKTIRNIIKKLRAERPQVRKVKRGEQVFEQRMPAQRTEPPSAPEQLEVAQAPAVQPNTQAQPVSPESGQQDQSAPLVAGQPVDVPARSVPAKPMETYQAIVISPPWDTRRVEEIRGWPVFRAAQEAALVWCWTDNAHLPDALACLEAWGFSYKTTMTLTRKESSPNEILNDQTEHWVVGVRGDFHAVLAERSETLTTALDSSFL
jgi:hypothetical protein